ncbi:MAG: hypothetical protein QXD43_03555 [Candidatus Aenigmatarchaeota archaeon]
MINERLPRKRLVAIEKRIADLHPDSDVRVRLIGTVIDSGPNSIVLDDGSGKIEIYFDEQPNVVNGQLIRVIARILPLIDGYECRGEIIQNLDNFNLELYKKAKEIVG